MATKNLQTDSAPAELARTPVTKQQIIESLCGLEKTAGFSIRIAELTIFEQLYTHLKGSEISIGEFTILRCIGLNPGLRQGVLADTLHVKWPSMTKLINALELRRLLKRVVPLNNRRSVELELTPEGEVMVEKYAPKFIAAESEIFSMLDDDEYKQLEKLLRKAAGWLKE
uniref:MarR family transcriptional regulator n=1 Tax=OCS116 cluster bacterium TaxID=2030921 RepID=A0A2A4Z5G5_9PROT